MTESQWNSNGSGYDDIINAIQTIQEDTIKREHPLERIVRIRLERACNRVMYFRRQEDVDANWLSFIQCFDEVAE